MNARFDGFLLCLFLMVGTIADALPKIVYDQVHGNMEKDRKMLLVFDEAVVAREQVGQPVDGSFLKTEPALQFEALWEAPNIAAIIVRDNVPFRSVYTWKTAPDTRSATGNVIPEVLGHSHGKLFTGFFVQARTNRGGVPNVYVTSSTPITAEQFQKPFFKDNETGTLTPAKALTFTAAQARELRNYLYDSSLLEKWIEENPKCSPDEILPNIIGFTPETPLTPEHKYSITIRELEPPPPFDAPNRGKIIPIDRIQSFRVNDISSINRSKKLFIETSVPIAAKDLPAIFKDDITIKADNKVAANSSSGLSKTVKVDGTDITFFLDTKRLATQDNDETNCISYIPITVVGNSAFKCHIIVKNLVAIDGQRLLNNTATIATEIRPEDPSVALDTGNSVMLAGGARILQIQNSSMTNNLRVKAKKLPVSYAPQALYNYSRYYEGSRSSRKDETVLEQRMRLLPYDILPYEEESPDLEINASESTTSVSFDELFSKRVSPGMYLVHIFGDAPDITLKAYQKFGGNGMAPDDFRKRKTVSCAAQSLVQITDLGMLWKRAGDTASVYAYKLSTGRALTNGSCQFTNRSGQVLARGSIKNGLCTLSIPEGAEIIRLSAHDDSVAMLLDNGEINLYSSGVSYPPYWMDEMRLNPAMLKQRTVFMFTDRNLYQPGEQAHIKGIVRTLQGNDISVNSLQKAVFSMMNPNNGQIFVRQLVSLTPEGTFETTVTFPEDATGDFQATLYFPTDEQNEKITTFDDEPPSGNETYYERTWRRRNQEFTLFIPVHEFKRKTFEVSMDIPALKPGATVIPVSTFAVNLTGIPVSGAKISWVLRTRPTNFYPKNLSGYEFGDYTENDSEYWNTYYGIRDGWYGMSVSSNKNGALNMEGKAHAELPLYQRNEARAMYIEISGTVTNGNNITVSRTASGRVDPSKVYVGLKRNSRLTSTDEPLKLDLIAVGLDGKSYSHDIAVKIDVTRQVFFPTRYLSGNYTTIKNEDEQFSVFSEETLIPAHPARPDAIMPKQVAIPTDQPGIYTVTLTGKDEDGNNFMTATKYWVYGGGRSPWLYRNGIGMELVPDKTLYKTGDTAKILLQTPVEGDVVVMVERNSVLRTYRKRVSLTDSVVEVPIEAGDAPNVYASVFLVKGAIESNRIAGMPQLKLGYCTLHVDPEEYRLNVTCKTPEGTVLPGSPQELTGTVTDGAKRPVAGAEVTLFVEDEGILSTLGYNNPKPLDYFYSTRILGVKTYSPLGRLLDENLTARNFGNKGIFVGGGDDLQEKMDNNPDMPRRNFAPCAFWKADLVTDEQGHFQASFTNQDTLTRYRVIAVAVQGPRFGTGNSEYVVNKPVMAEPGTPMFASQGDELKLSVELSKSSPRQGKWQVNLESADPNIVRIDETSRIVTIPDKGSIAVSLPATFTGTGDACLTWIVRPVDDQGKLLPEADVKGLSDRVESRFPVTFPAPLLRERHAFALDQSGEWNPAKVLSPELQQVNGTLTVEMSTSPMVQTAESMRFLLRYPYGCLEQVSSAMVPWIYADIFSQYCPDFPPYTPEQRKRTLDQAIDSLLARQGINGTLSYWNRNETNCVFSPYAALVMLLAQEQQIAIPRAPLKNLLKSLDKLPDIDANPLARWVRARSKLLSDADFNRLLDTAGKTESCSDTLLEILALAESPDQVHRNAATAMLDKLPALEENTVTGNITPALELLARATLKPDDPATLQSFDKLLQPYASNTRFNTTWQNAWNLIAMAHYLKTSRPVLQDTAVTWKNQGSIVTVSARGKAINQKFSLPYNMQGNLTVSGAGKIFAHATAEGKPTRIDFPGVTDKGMTVLRKYEVLDKTGAWIPAGTLNKGDIVRITLEVIPTRLGYRYVAIEDNMPSSFEAIDPGLLRNPGSMPDGFSCPPMVSNQQFFKDKVRFFVDNMPQENNFRASYLARVVRAGKVTIPPAKAELMYEPQIYGLSISERLTVANEEGNK